MDIAFYSATAGMIAQQDALNVYSNNIANVNTSGFKAERPSFSDCIYTVQRATEADWQTGHGTYIAKTDLMWERGSYTDTSQPLDYALPNDGFFMVADGDGNTFLTRQGSFEMSQGEDGVWKLVNGNGEYVLDYEGNQINIPFEINDAGEQTDNVDYAALTDAIGVFSVENKWGLDNADSNHFVVTERSGAVTAAPELDKVEYALEMSTTDLAGDMVHIIETQRSYQLNARIVQTADELENIANNLR